MLLPVEPYPGLRLAAFTTAFPAPLAELPATPTLSAGLRLDAAIPLGRDENVRQALRDLLRRRGYKPTGRGKPASEYLVGAAEAGTLASINAAVDACNVVSLHSGLPISVVDVDRARAPFHIGLPLAGSSYVFNASGQEIRLDGLLCLFDAEGPCANAVRDSQRTKTHGGTRRTLSVVWGAEGFEGRLAEATAWYREALHALGATTETAEPTEAP